MIEFKDLKPGKYEAKIVDYGQTEGKTSAQIVVKFGIKDGPTMTWYCGFQSDKAQEILLKNLILMGAVSSNIALVSRGPSSGALNMNKVFSLEIEDHTYNGKTTKRIKYINDPDARRSSPSTTMSTNAPELSFLTGMAAAYEAMNGKLTKEPTFNTEDVPF